MDGQELVVIGKTKYLYRTNHRAFHLRSRIELPMLLRVVGCPRTRVSKKSMIYLPNRFDSSQEGIRMRSGSAGWLKPRV